MTLPFIDARTLSVLMPPAAAVAALEDGLRDGLDPESDAPRLFSPLAAGEFLLMPAESSRYAGIKVVTVAPENPSRGQPKIQGTYLLFDAQTLTPLAAFEGAELTLIRTPAVTAMAVKHMLAAGGRESIDRLVVLGTSLQAARHIQAVTAIMAVAEVVIIGRSGSPADDHARELARACAGRSADARAGGHSDIPGAEAIISATSSPTPVFDGSAVASDAVVAAIGAHGLGAREIDEGLVRRSDIVVEGRASALRESGNLMSARSGAEWEHHRVTNLAELVAGGFRRTPGAPSLYSGVGMSWEDLVVASGAFEQTGATMGT
ncbi:MAG: ornithine cyclodeaminase family protein [Actinomycetota bacterium]|nr:ornithine cyclodeaminase family protein [Actinomycetota bacterium]